MTQLLPPLHEGHAPIFLHLAFQDALEAFESWRPGEPEPLVDCDGKPTAISAVFGRMRTCTDIMPVRIARRRPGARRRSSRRRAGRPERDLCRSRPHPARPLRRAAEGRLTQHIESIAAALDAFPSLCCLMAQGGIRHGSRRAARSFSTSAAPTPSSCCSTATGGRCASGAPKAATCPARPTGASTPSRRWRCSPRPCRISTRTLPVDVIVPCAHGSALALLDEAGALALPVMDYLAEPPAEIVAAYREIAPPFAEVFCPVNPMALTLGLQLFWQETAFPEDFAARPHDPALGPVFRLSPDRPRRHRLHRAWRADPARRRASGGYLLAGAPARLGPAVRAAGAALRDARRAEAGIPPRAACRACSRSRPASTIPTPTICAISPPASAISRCCRPAPGSSSSTPDPISAASTPAATPPPTPTLFGAPGRLQPLHGRAGDRRDRGRRAGRFGHGGASSALVRRAHLRAAVLHQFRRPDAGHRRPRQDRRPAAAERRRALRRLARSIAR